LSIEFPKGIPPYFKPVACKQALGSSLGLSKFQQEFLPKPSQVKENTQALEKLASDPSLSRLLVANGGYGLQSFVQSLGLMDVDGSLGDACARLLSLSGSQISGATPGRAPCSILPRISRKDNHSSPGRESPDQAVSHFREETIEEESSGELLLLPYAAPARSALPEPELSSLAARFESGELGCAAIGYDQVGGTSYGLYQIASKPGTMERFIDFLEQNAPDLGQKLRSAGPANTGSKEGPMPDVWRAIAAEEPKRFADLQKSFIEQTHFEPAVKKFKELTGLDVKSMSQAVQEVLWSTAVQHGATGGANLFAEASDKAGNPDSDGFEFRLIEQVYAERSGRFNSSTQRVQNAVQNRFLAEKQLALLMLQDSGQA